MCQNRANESWGLSGTLNKFSESNLHCTRHLVSGWPSLTAVPVWDTLWPRRATFFPPRMDHLFSVDHLFPTLYRNLGPPEIFGWWPPWRSCVAPHAEQYVISSENPPTHHEFRSEMGIGKLHYRNRASALLGNSFRSDPHVGHKTRVRQFA